MGSLLHPVGPEEPRVYWVRRALVCGVAAIVVVGLVFLFWPRPEAVVVGEPPTTSGTTPPSDQPTPATTPTDPASSSGPQACDPALLNVTVHGLQRVKLGTKEPFALSVVNNGAQPCVLTISPATYSLTVSSGKDRIWTTADCAAWLPAKTLTVAPQQAHEFQVEWSVKRSSANCKTSKQPIQPGTYVAKAVLLERATARQVLQVVK